MKKFMKFCFILAMVLIIAGCVCYMVGRSTDGGDRMDEVLSRVSGDWVHLDLDNDWGAWLSDNSYDIDDISMFSGDYEIWQGDVERRRLCQGNIAVLDLEIGGSVVEIQESDDEYVYIESSNSGKLQAYVEDSTLYVKAVRPSNLFNEISNSSIILYLPEDCKLMQLVVSLGAGQLKLEDLKVDCMEAQIGAGQLLMEGLELSFLEVSLGAGEVKAEDVAVDILTAEIGAGNLELSGAIHEGAEISCSMGNVSMELEGEPIDFNYELSCVAGNMEIGEDKFSGATQEREIDNGAEKYMNIDCSMGNVEVDFE